MSSSIDWPKIVVSVIVGLVIWFIPRPDDLSPEAWSLFAIFLGTITAVVLKPIPLGAVALVSLAVTTGTGLLSFPKAFQSYSHPILWLILFAFFIARGFIKTGLGARLAYHLVALLGKKTLSLSYGLAISDLMLAPAIPSVTARCGGILFPVIRSLSEAFDSHPGEPTRRRIGAFLTLTAYNVTVITSAMFITAMAGNPLIVELADKVEVELTWALWAQAAIVPGLISLALTPAVIYLIYPPEITHTPNAQEFARKKLEEMGSMSASEGIMLVVFLLLIVLWVGGAWLQINATVAALLGVSLLLLSGVLRFDDLMAESAAWETYIWFGALLTLAKQLNEMGVMDELSQRVLLMLGGVGGGLVLVLLSLIFFYSHYFFASSTAHIGAMYGAFLTLAVWAGAPPMLSALVLAFFSNLCGCLTHYGSGPAPLLYGSGYTPMKAWWGVGAAVSVLHLLVWGGVGMLWWSALGLW